MTQIIKTKLTENITNISAKVKQYVSNKVGFQYPPPIIQNIRIYQSPFKKSLTDWRKFYSNKKNNYTSALSPKNKQNAINDERRAFSSYANRSDYCCTPSQTCRRTFTRQNKKQAQTQRVQKKESFLKFALVQNQIQNNLTHFSEKRQKTARIKKYYQNSNRKGISEFKVDMNFLNQEASQTNQIVENNMRTDNSKIELILNRKSKRRIDLIPDEYYKNYNRVKIHKRNLIKNQKFLSDTYREWSSCLGQYRQVQSQQSQQQPQT